MKATLLDWARGYGLGYRAATEVRANHGQTLVNVNAQHLRKNTRDDWDRGYSAGYEDARDRKPNLYPHKEAGK